MVRRIGYDDRGYRVGESHHNARLSDELVRLIRDLHEDPNGTGEKLSVRAIAVRLKLAYETVSKICKYQRRVGIVARWRRLPDRPPESGGGLRRV